ncbi:hypothetical protein CROQUDRAFT_716008 [Cronartium quercuum f. sp. fusiforme G11]|uniref:Uncharacterized protein n=1 Tax=Cronartium quercuum f. sp. fusiforme G11 TaxID=708437 RepID=A0A9P6NHD9_9BASI|nr:hypothetical protein CROQUDRAFT_716008 [Cronartium quercuum f. sp. fusiforme G11]
MNLLGIVSSWVVLPRLVYHCKALPMETSFFSGGHQVAQDLNAGRGAIQELGELGHESIIASKPNGLHNGQAATDILRQSRTGISVEHTSVPISRIENLNAASTPQLGKFWALPKKWIQRIWNAVVNLVKKRPSSLFIGRDELNEIDAIYTSIMNDRNPVKVLSEDYVESRIQQLEQVQEILNQGSSLHDPRYAKYLSESVRQEQLALLPTVKNELTRLRSLDDVRRERELVAVEREAKNLPYDGILEKVRQLFAEKTNSPPLNPLATHESEVDSRLNELFKSAIENHRERAISLLRGIGVKLRRAGAMQDDFSNHQIQFDTVNIKNMQFEGSEIQTGLGKNYPPVVANYQGEKVLEYQKYLETLSNKVDGLLSHEEDRGLTEYRRILTNLRQAVLQEQSRVDEAISKEWKSVELLTPEERATKEKDALDALAARLHALRGKGIPRRPPPDSASERLPSPHSSFHSSPRSDSGILD